jgi:predicted alpha/beta superfamily hydrolase
MKSYLSFLCFLFTSFAFAQTQSPIVIGQTQAIQSQYLKEKRIVNIYLPESYHLQDTSKYPVIYIIDGGIQEDFFHITGIIRFNTQPWINRFPESIVVGIENTDRRRDCSFAVNNLLFLDKMGFRKEQFPTYGGSANYITFIEKELQPFINKTYKTNGSNTVIGESFAGLLATEILLKHRQLFHTYIIMSPSLWWGNESLLKEAPEFLQSGNACPVDVYIGACDKEEDSTMYNDAVTLSEILKKYGNDKIKVFYDYIPDEIHSTMMHQAVYNALKLLYPHTVYQKK